VKEQKSIIGYSYTFLLFLIIAKIFYLSIESAYNTIILDSVTIKDINYEIFNNYQELGHIISSLGATLLLLGIYYKLLFKPYKEIYFKNIFNYFNPFFYLSLFFCFLFGEKDSNKKICKLKNIFYVKNKFIGIILFILLAFGTYKSLYIFFEHTLNFLVKQNLDKKYEAYYLNILKKGIAEGFFNAGYFLNIQNLNNLTTEQKVLLNNIFILNYLNKNLINKVFQHYKDYIYFKINNDLTTNNEIKKYIEYFHLIQKKLKLMYSSYTKLELKFNKAYEQTLKDLKKGNEVYLNTIGNYDYIVYKYYLIALNLSKIRYKNTYAYFKSNEFRKKFRKFLQYYYNGGMYRKKALENYQIELYSFFPVKIPSVNEWRKTPYGYGYFLNNYAIKKLAQESVLQFWGKGNYELFYINKYHPYYNKVNKKEKSEMKKIKKTIHILGKNYHYTFKVFNPFKNAVNYVTFIYIAKDALKKDFLSNLTYMKKQYINDFISKKENICNLSPFYYKKIDAEQLANAVINQNVNKIDLYFKKVFEWKKILKCVNKHFYQKFKTELQKHGFYYIPPNLNYKEFLLNHNVYNKLKMKIKKKNKTFNEIFLKNSLKFIADNKTEKNLKVFLKKVVLPSLEYSYLKYQLSFHQLNNEKYYDLAIKALKALFIPPFAITLSLIFGILNLLTLIGLIIVLLLKIIYSNIKDNTLILIKNLIILSGLIITGYYLLFFNGLNKRYQSFFNKADNIYMKYYIKMLPQIIILEDKNYKIGLQIRKKIFNEKKYGL
jgi:hypothetical protein